MAIRTSLILLLLHLQSEIAFAASGHGTHEGSLLLPVVNFITFIIAAYFLLKTPISSALLDRSKSFEAELRKGQAELDSAKAKLSKAQELLSGVNAEIGRLTERIGIDAEMESDALIAQAKERAVRVVAQGKSIASAELKAARDSIKRELIAASIKSARAMVSEKASDASDKLLRNRALQSVSGILNG